MTPSFLFATMSRCIVIEEHLQDVWIRKTQRTDTASWCGYYLSLFGVWLCPLGILCSGMWALAALGKAEVELELLVLKSRPSACFRASSLLGIPDTSFHSCWRSDGHIAAERGCPVNFHRRKSFIKFTCQNQNHLLFSKLMSNILGHQRQTSKQH